MKGKPKVDGGNSDGFIYAIESYNEGSFGKTMVVNTPFPPPARTKTSIVTIWIPPTPTTAQPPTLSRRR